jgi:hypothetical protein
MGRQCGGPPSGTVSSEMLMGRQETEAILRFPDETDKRRVRATGSARRGALASAARRVQHQRSADALALAACRPPDQIRAGTNGDCVLHTRGRITTGQD